METRNACESHLDFETNLRNAQYRNYLKIASPFKTVEETETSTEDTPKEITLIGSANPKFIPNYENDHLLRMETFTALVKIGS
jgi:hypothetical protein